MTGDSARQAVEEHAGLDVPAVAARSGEAGLSIVIVNWNTRDHLEGCLQSAAQFGPTRVPWEVIVVDNASTDGSAAMVRSRWPEVRLIENRTNEGFARANNRAIRASEAEYVLLLNSDARLTPGALDRLLNFMASHPRAGVIGPRLVYGDGQWQRWTAGRAPSLSAAINHYLFVDRLRLGDHTPRSLYLTNDVRTAFRPDWISGACMLVRRAALRQVGLFDEAMFLYMEDVDLCRRMRQGGWDVWYCPDAVVVHYMSQSTTREAGSASPAALRAFNAYFAREHGELAGGLLRFIEAVGCGVRAALCAAAALARHGDPSLRARARAHWRFFRVSLEPIRTHSSFSSSSGS